MVITLGVTGLCFARVFLVRFVHHLCMNEEVLSPSKYQMRLFVALGSHLNPNESRVWSAHRPEIGDDGALQGGAGPPRDARGGASRQVRRRAGGGGTVISIGLPTQASRGQQGEAALNFDFRFVFSGGRLVDFGEWQSPT